MQKSRPTQNKRARERAKQLKQQEKIARPFRFTAETTDEMFAVLKDPTRRSGRSTPVRFTLIMRIEASSSKPWARARQSR